MKTLKQLCRNGIETHSASYRDVGEHGVLLLFDFWRLFGGLSCGDSTVAGRIVHPDIGGARACLGFITSGRL